MIIRQMLTGVVLLAVAAVVGPAAGQPTAAAAPPHAATIAVAAGPAAAAAAVAAAPSDDPIDRVVTISIDGLNARAITTIGPSGAVAFHRLMREGALHPERPVRP